MEGWYRLALGTLCVWRVTHLLHREDGPWDLVVKLRRAAGSGMAGRMLDCFYCLSMWVAMPFALLLGETWREQILLIPALSASAILVNRATTSSTQPPVAWYHEAEEVKDVVLRAEADRAVDDGVPRG